MDFLTNLWNSPTRYVVIVIAAVIIIYIPFMIAYMNKKKKQADKFLIQHPNAAKVYITGAMRGTLTVLRVNDEAPNTFFEGAKQGFFLLPGESTIEAQYQWTRPGVMHKTVTTTVGPHKIQVTAQAQRKYNIGYDKSKETYDFIEIK